jgi:predicted transcriptional regulator
MADGGTFGMLLARKDAAIWSISPNATAFEAIQLVSDENVGAPMVKNARLIGITSERDGARKAILKGRSLRDTSIRNISPPEWLATTQGSSITRMVDDSRSSDELP